MPLKNEKGERPEGSILYAIPQSQGACPLYEIRQAPRPLVMETPQQESTEQQPSLEEQFKKPAITAASSVESSNPLF